MYEELECGICKEKVRKMSWNQRFCSPTCTEKHRANEVIRKWVEKKPRKKIDPDTAARMERSATYNKTAGWGNKFTACRG